MLSPGRRNRIADFFKYSAEIDPFDNGPLYVLILQEYGRSLALRFAYDNRRFYQFCFSENEWGNLEELESDLAEFVEEKLPGIKLKRERV